MVTVGVSSMAADLFAVVCDAAKAAEEAVIERNSVVKQTYDKLKPPHTRFLLAMSFQVEAMKKFKNMEVNFKVSRIFHPILFWL